MPIPRISQSVAKRVLSLHDDHVDLAEIARQLDLKRAQVSAIIAHRDLRLTTSNTAERESSEIGRLVVDEYSGPAEPDAPTPTIDADTVEFRDEATEPAARDEEAHKGILLGPDVEYGDPLHWNPEDASTVQNPHLMIVGESGSGKTYAVQSLTAELSQRNIPSVIFDYGQGFELHTLDPTYVKYTTPAEYRVGEEGVALNPLQMFPNDVHGPKSVATRVADIFDAVYHLGDIQRKVLIEAILRTYARAGITDSRSSWKNPAPNLSALEEVLEELASDKEYPNSRNAVGLSARLTTFFMLTSFGGDGAAWSWASILGDAEHHVHILQFRGLEGKTQRVLVEVLLWHLFFYLKSHGQDRLRLYCVLDEAHHLSFREGGPVDLLLREARKFGLGIIFASQQPEDFSDVAFSNTATKLVFQTTDSTHKVSRFLAAKCSNYDSPEQVHDVISVLPQGEAFLLTRNRGNKVRIADLRRRATLWSDQ